MKTWWIRHGKDGEYGSWMPTGCTDKDAAIEYVSLYLGLCTVKEWLLL